MANSDSFSLFIHHGGKFIMMEGRKKYEGGDMSSNHLLDVDRFGYLDLEDEVEKLGYDSWDGLWYKVPNTSNYKLINDDKEVLEMTSYVFKGSNSFCIFVENGMVRGDKDENIQEKHGEIFSENSSKDDDYNPIGESETDDGLSDDELVSDDEEYLEARQNKKKSPLEFPDRRVAEIIRLPSYVQGDEEIGGFQSDYEDSNDEVNSNSSGSELSFDNTTGGRQKKRRVTYDPKCDHKSLKLVLGMRFLDSYQCKHAIQTISLVHGYPIHFTRSNKRQCEAKCIPECGWKCYGSIVKMDQSFVIKTLSSDGHKCPRSMDNKQATASWLASEYLETVRDNPNIRIKELQTDMMRKYACQVSKWRLYRAKKQALEMIRGSLSDHYAWVRSFVAELMKVDSEGRYEIQVSDGGLFQAMYIGYSALKHGFLRGCRPIIGLDGCFLKTVLGGVLLCAVSKDGNNQMFPIAWAVVEVENQSCWSWFLKILMDELGITDGLGFTFISDQQKGLINAVADLAPYAEHRNCARHVYCNWKKTYKGPTLKNIFWKAVRATYIESFNSALEDMRAENEAAYLNFLEREPQKFCKAFVSTIPACDMIDNNVSETFNGFIIEARGKHLIDMLQDIGRQLMKRQYVKFTAIGGFTDKVCPNIRAKIEQLKYESRLCIVTPALNDKYEIQSGDDQFIVNMGNKTCTCRSWDLTGIPCLHACAAMTFLKVEAGDYVADYFTVNRYIEAYCNGIEPLNSRKMWPKVSGDPVQPPKVRRMPGRPKKKRRRSAEEKEENISKLKRFGFVVTCRRCFQEGHNKRTCKNEPVQRPTKPTVRRGRPRKENSIEHQPNSTVRGRGRPRKNISQPSSSNIGERSLAKSGYGVLGFEGTGHIYMRMPGNKEVHLVNSDGGSRGRGGLQEARRSIVATSTSGVQGRGDFGTQESRTLN